MTSNIHRIKAAAAVFGTTALLLIALACGSAEDDSGPVTDYASLLNRLVALGAEVGIRGFSAQTFFLESQGRLLEVNNQDVLVFQFGNPQDADAAGEAVSVDGSTIGGIAMSWDAAPHFYKAGVVIVLYVGTDNGVISSLQGALGSQFAGQ